ncbi:MAG: cell division protease FtsH, partial [Pseudomonadota bacterium]|nr:cell division protease FtsH [Pseudomonadota bacterium]
NYTRSMKILTENLHILHMMADALIKYETIDSHQIDQLMRGEEPSPPADWDDTDGSAKSGKSKKSAPDDKPAEDKKDGSIGGPASLH